MNQGASEQEDYDPILVCSRSAVGHEEPLQTVAVLEEMLASGEQSLSNTRVKEVVYGWMNNCFYEAKSFIEANGKFVIDFSGIGTRPVMRK